MDRKLSTVFIPPVSTEKATAEKESLPALTSSNNHALSVPKARGMYDPSIRLLSAKAIKLAPKIKK